MKRIQRKTNPKVRDGKVQKKNRHAPTPSYWNTLQCVPVIDKEKPGRDHRHYLRKDDITRFIQILPDWDELSKDLDAVVLAKGGGPDGWFHKGVIGICAWPRDSRVLLDIDGFKEHAEIFERLNVKSHKQDNHYVCLFSEAQVKAYQLLHIFLHELGHHHNRKTDHSKQYTEEYAKKYEANIWQSYINEFQPEEF